MLRESLREIFFRQADEAIAVAGTDLFNPILPEKTLHTRHEIDVYAVESIFERSLLDAVGYEGAPLFSRSKKDKLRSFALSDVTGCVSSRNGTGGRFSKIESPVPASHEDAVLLYNQIFNGKHDCINLQGSPVCLIEQEWNNEKWMINSGGSHRAAALVKYSQNTGNEFHLDAEVIKVSVTDALAGICNQWDIWECRADYNSAQELKNTLLNPRGFKNESGEVFSSDGIKIVDTIDGVMLCTEKSAASYSYISSVMKSKGIATSITGEIAKRLSIQSPAEKCSLEQPLKPRRLMLSPETV